MSKHLSVIESTEALLIRDGSVTALSNQEADELHRYVTRHQLDVQNILIGRSEVRFINYVGIIQLTTCTIEVLPKVRGNNPGRSRRLLLRMLQSTNFLDFQESEISEVSLETANLYEILGYLFAIKLKNELGKGPYFTYQVVEENLMQIKGKISFTRQLMNDAFKSSKVYCIYDRFDINSRLNQVFKAALVVLTKQVVYAETQKLLRICLSLLDEVEYVPAHVMNLNSIRLDRTNKRFSACFSLAKLILSGTAITPNLGQEKNVSILFKMNDLFEAYIAALARRLNRDVSIQDKSHKLLVKESSGKGVFQLIPDIVMTKSNGVQVIVDTKWKLISGYRGVQREDLYQMYAYLTRYKQASTAVLLYPGTEGDSVPLEVWQLEDQPNKKVKVFTIDYENESESMRLLREVLQS